MIQAIALAVVIFGILPAAWLLWLAAETVRTGKDPWQTPT